MSVGFQVYPNKDKYEGEWADNMRNGQGVLECANGDKYDGDWTNDKKGPNGN